MNRFNESIEKYNRFQLLYISDEEEKIIKKTIMNNNNNNNEIPIITNNNEISIITNNNEIPIITNNNEIPIIIDDNKDNNKEVIINEEKKEVIINEKKKELNINDYLNDDINNNDNNIYNNIYNDDIYNDDIDNNDIDNDDIDNDINNNYKIKYDKDFIDPVILDNINLYYYFDKNDIAYVEKYKKSHLKITDKGLYSISKPLDAQWISEQIIKEFNNLKINTVIDGTAGIGGNVISFAKYFKNVVGIELNKIHYNVLKENIQLLDLKNVRLYNDNILTYYEHIQERDKSIFFIDPPWGGRKYKNFKNFILKIGKYYIYEFIETLYKNGFKHIVIKAPLNLNVNLIVQNISFKNIKVIKHINMMLLMIS